jgi:hypothetical protein
VRECISDSLKRPKQELRAEMTFRSVMSELFATFLGNVRLKELHARLPENPVMTGTQHDLLGNIFTATLKLEYGDKYDADQDQAGNLGLSRAGMSKALAEMGLRDEDVEFVFQSIDADHSDLISLLEFKRAYRNIWNASVSLKSAEPTMDDDQDE